MDCRFLRIYEKFEGAKMYSTHNEYGKIYKIPKI